MEEEPQKKKLEDGREAEQEKVNKAESASMAVCSTLMASIHTYIRRSKEKKMLSISYLHNPSLSSLDYI